MVGESISRAYTIRRLTEGIGEVAKRFAEQHAYKHQLEVQAHDYRQELKLLRARLKELEKDARNGKRSTP